MNRGRRRKDDKRKNWREKVGKRSCKKKWKKVIYHIGIYIFHFELCQIVWVQ